VEILGLSAAERNLEEERLLGKKIAGDVNVLN
jgi:hypothetical protein